MKLVSWWCDKYMAFSYNKDPKNCPNDKIRFLIGDTIEDKHLVEDEEIVYALDKCDNAIYSACALLCTAIATKFAREGEVRTSNFTTSKTSVYKNYMALAKMFGSKIASPAHLIMPSMSVSDKDINDSDTDKVQPAFKKNLMDNPETSSETVDEDLA
jgi:hypothetical protein